MAFGAFARIYIATMYVRVLCGKFLKIHLYEFFGEISRKASKFRARLRKNRLIHFYLSENLYNKTFIFLVLFPSHRSASLTFVWLKNVYRQNLPTANSALQVAFITPSSLSLCCQVAIVVCRVTFLCLQVILTFNHKKVSVS